MRYFSFSWLEKEIVDVDFLKVNGTVSSLTICKGWEVSLNNQRFSGTRMFSTPTTNENARVRC